MAKYRCPWKFIFIVQQFDDGMQARVQNNGETPKPFPVSNGVKQGCILSPTLFSLVFSAMLTDAFRDADVRIGIRYRTDGTLFSLRRLQAKTKVMTDIIRDLLFQRCLRSSCFWHARKLNHFHTTCLRKLLNNKWQDRIPDTEVLAQAGLSSIYTILMQSQLRWAGHVCCILNRWLPKRLFYGELRQGKHSHGAERSTLKPL